VLEQQTMVTVLESVPRSKQITPAAGTRLPVAAAPGTVQLSRWLETQATTAARHAAALRPFARDEFGSGPASPSDAHANDLTHELRRNVVAMSRVVQAAARGAQHNPSSGALNRLLTAKETMLAAVRRTEEIWKFYLELFGQRQSSFGPLLLACDRIALDCYQYVYTGLGRAKPVPSPAPFCYLETGFSPATYRRGIPMPKLGRGPNPFPLIQLPYHRLINPWTLGAVLHESAHNLQSDLGLWRAVPLRIARHLLAARIPHEVVRVWARWHKETWADLAAVLLGGPEIVASLMDVTGRSAAAAQRFNPRDVHPTPWLRVFINIELLQRMGFVERARAYRAAWSQLYSAPQSGWMPDVMLKTFPEACRIVVDTIAFAAYPELGGKTLAQAFKFEARDQGMVEEAAQRLAASRDPGIIPALFLIGAARHALDHRWASPETITRNFYRALVRR
jgi:hypothetical protein